MGVFGKVLKFITGDTLQSIASVVDRFVQTKEEKQQLMLELQRILQEREEALEQTYRYELEAKARVMEAELRQGDTYTKRARPTVVYSGIALVLFEIVAHIASSIWHFGYETPEVVYWFLTTWAGVVGVYVIGRSAEKVKLGNRATQLITGTAKPEVLKELLD